MLLRDSATVFSAFTGSSVNAVATLRRKRRQSSIINAKKIYDEAQMVRRVRAYLQNLNVIEDEAQLVNLSQLCEPPPAGLITFPLNFFCPHILRRLLSSQTFSNF